MSDEPRRDGPRLVHMLVFVAATAVGLTYSRTYLEDVSHHYGNHGIRPPLRFPVVAPTLAAWSAAVLALRAIHRRTPQPGASAPIGTRLCVAAMLGVGLAALSAVAQAIDSVDRGGLWHYHSSKLDGIIFASRIVGAIVLGALVAALLGGPRRRADWIDSAGLLVGLAWIILFALVTAPGAYTEYLLTEWQPYPW